MNKTDGDTNSNQKKQIRFLKIKPRHTPQRQSRSRAGINLPNRIFDLSTPEPEQKDGIIKHINRPCKQFKNTERPSAVPFV